MAFSARYVFAWVTALCIIMAIAQLYGYILGQDQQTRFTVFAATSIGVLVVLPQHSEKAKAAREKLKRSTVQETQAPSAAPPAAATRKTGKKGRTKH